MLEGCSTSFMYLMSVISQEKGHDIGAEQTKLLCKAGTHLHQKTVTVRITIAIIRNAGVETNEMVKGTNSTLLKSTRIFCWSITAIIFAYLPATTVIPPIRFT